MLQLLCGHCPSSASCDAPEEPRSLEKLLALCSVDSAPLAHGNRLLTTQASANLLVDVLQEHLMEDFAPASAASSGSVVEWRSAVGMKAVSPLLYDAFPAAALIMAGFRDQSQALQIAGQARYVRVLRLLQDTLRHPSESLSTAALVAVVLFTIVEVRISLSLSLSLAAFS
jgi:hypothetical protein